VFTEEKTFNLRLNLEVAFPDEYDGDEDHQAWLSEWEDGMKGEVIKRSSLRSGMLGELDSHMLNRANGRRPLLDDDGDYAAFGRSAKWFLTPF
jgi:hypothetical protein